MAQPSQVLQRRPSPVLVAVSCAGLLALTGAVVVAGSGPHAWPWPVTALLWVAFLGLRQDRVQRWLAGGDLRHRTVRRVLFGQALGTAALLSCALPGLVPLVCALVAGVHVEWRWRRALEAGSAGGLVLSAATAAGVATGALPGLHGAVEQVAALGLASLLLANVAILARQRERSDAALDLARRPRHAELLHAAQHDALTGLLGRRGAAVVFCDLDGFKPVNDTHGHDVGDRVLVAVGQRLLAAAGPSARVGRTGGDEFVVVLHGAADAAAVHAVAQRASACLDDPLAVDGAPVALGLSCGSAWSEVPVPGEELLRRADASMYAVKATRRGRRATDRAASST